MHCYREEEQMPYITSIERSAMRKGMLHAIGLTLQRKFGEPGLQLLPELSEIRDYDLLLSVFEAIDTAASPDDLRRVWTRKRPKKGRRT
jgi:hypothetical protein